MIAIGDRVNVSFRIGAEMLSGTVVGIIPALGDRVAMYRVRFDQNIVAPTLTPNPNERWVDDSMVYESFEGD